MPNTLALFALFAIGSAVDCADGVVNCTTGSADNVFIGTCYKNNVCTVTDGCNEKGDYCGTATNVGTCDATLKCKSVVVSCGGSPPATKACRSADNFIGLCSKGSGDLCNSTTSLCKGGTDAKDSVCEAESLKGKCTAKNGKCKSSEFVKVVYTVMTDATATSAVVQKLTHDNYATGLAGDLKTYTKNTATHCDMAKTPTRKISGGNDQIVGNVVCTGKVGEACTVVCDGGKLPDGFTKRCDDTAQWVGDYGSCKDVCPLTEGTYTHATATTPGLFEVTKVVPAGGGKIFCPDAFHETKCYVKCTDSSDRVKIQTNYTCKITSGGSKLWTLASGDPSLVKGVCDDSVDVLASANILLGYDDDHEQLDDISTPGYKAFETRFRKAVVANLPAGVLEANIIIKSIALIPNADARRLNEKTVKVDYTIRKIDTDGRLLVGGGLRGVN